MALLVESSSLPKFFSKQAATKKQLDQLADVFQNAINYLADQILYNEGNLSSEVSTNKSDITALLTRVDSLETITTSLDVAKISTNESNISALTAKDSPTRTEFDLLNVGLADYISHIDHPNTDRHSADNILYTPLVAGSIIGQDATVSEIDAAINAIDALIGDLETRTFANDAKVSWDNTHATTTHDWDYIYAASGDTKIPISYIDSLVIGEIRSYADIATMIADANAGLGDIGVVTATSETYMHNGGTANDITDWTKLLFNRYTDQEAVDALATTLTDYLLTVNVKTAYEANNDTNAYTDAAKTKVDFLTVTEAINLDSTSNTVSSNTASIGQIKGIVVYDGGTNGLAVETTQSSPTARNFATAIPDNYDYLEIIVGFVNSSNPTLNEVVKMYIGAGGTYNQGRIIVVPTVLDVNSINTEMAGYFSLTSQSQFEWYKGLELIDRVGSANSGLEIYKIIAYRHNH